MDKIWRYIGNVTIEKPAKFLRAAARRQGHIKPTPRRDARAGIGHEAVEQPGSMKRAWYGIVTACAQLRDEDPCRVRVIHARCGLLSAAMFEAVFESASFKPHGSGIGPIHTSALWLGNRRNSA